MKARDLLIILLIVTIAVATLASQVLLERPQPCGNQTNPGSTILHSNLSENQFKGVKKYKLPVGRSPNAITIAVDGSVWFGEQSLPGVGHLYLNGTLVEYKWPFRYAAPSFSTFIWGVALWKGCVWASDQAESQLVALNPDTGSIRTIKLDAGSFPYTLVVGPDDSLWFTEVFASKIGRLDEQLHLHEYLLPVAGTPAQIAFANKTLGYYVDTGNVGFVEPAIFSFDPRDFSPIKVASGKTLRAPTSLALVTDGVWVTQHGASSLAFYDWNTHEWSLFPTSPVAYKDTTLPYFVAANGSLIWFNEHYANRIAVLNSRTRLLTEYSLSDPPASRITGIDNALTFALGVGRVWFTELTAGYVGYLDASYDSDFSLLPLLCSSVHLTKGGETSIALTIEGKSNRTLTVLFSDSETATSRPQKIMMNATATQFGSLNGRKEIVVTIKADKTLPAGNYALLVTVTDGLISQGAYIKLQITT